MTTTRIYTRQFETPFGDMLVALDEQDVLIRLIFPNEFDRWAAEITRKQYAPVPDTKHSDRAVAQLDEYFQGRRRSFDLPLRPEGTDFQRKVWAALLTIPYGTTITYGQLAERIGNPAAVRAVGRANGVNPIPVIIPCHRVIGAGGALTGFGGGLPLKEALLHLEGAPVGTSLYVRPEQPMLL